MLHPRQIPDAYVGALARETQLYVLTVWFSSKSREPTRTVRQPDFKFNFGRSTIIGS